MFQVIYVSEATETLTMRQLSSLLTEARKRNADLGLTGLLLYSRRRFMQVLEGPESAVMRVLHSIQNDLRHKNIDILRCESKDGRDFQDWRMGFRNFMVDAKFLPSVSKFLEPEFDVSLLREKSEAYHMLMAFRRAHDS